MNEKLLAQTNNALNVDNTIKTDNLIIRDNIMEWGNTMIQLSNVCSISTATFVKNTPNPLLAVGILLIVLGVLISIFSPATGIIFLIAGAIAAYMGYKKKNNPEKTMTLSIMMNSGSVFEFLFYDESFKIQVLHVLETIISGGNSLHIGDINIDIKNNHIDGNLEFMNGRV